MYMEASFPLVRDYFETFAEGRKRGEKDMNFMRTQWRDGDGSTIKINSDTTTLEGPYWDSIGISPGTYPSKQDGNGIAIAKKIQLILFHDGRLIVQGKELHFFKRDI